MGRKKTLEPDDWKQIRVRRGWLELIRMAHKKNPGFSPSADLSKASEPHLITRRVSGRVPGHRWVALGKAHSAHRPDRRPGATRRGDQGRRAFRGKG